MLKTLILQTTFGQIFYSKEDFFGEEKTGDSDISLTAGLISAIYSMTEETQEQKIEEIELEDLKSVFRELPGERLFIITVDKRMDDQDAADLLQDIIDGFFNKYGDLQADGKILRDFEPVVNEIVERKLWYNTVLPKMQWTDLIVFLTLMFSVIWYPYWFLGGETNIVGRIFNGLNEGFFSAVSALFVVLMGTVLPLLVNLVLLRKFPSLGLYFRYTAEFFRRPTRGGYAEGLPWWFVGIPILVSALSVSTIVFGRGFVYGWTVQPLPDALVHAYAQIGDDGQIFYSMWYYLAWFFLWYLLVWLVVFPIMLGVITGNLDWNFIKSASIVSSFGQILLLPGHIFAGTVYQKLIGINVEDDKLYSQAVSQLDYIFTVTVLIDVFLLVSIFFIGLGLNRLIKENKNRFPIAFGISIFAIFEILRLIFYVIFRTDIGGIPVFLE